MIPDQRKSGSRASSSVIVVSTASSFPDASFRLVFTPGDHLLRVWKIVLKDLVELEHALPPLQAMLPWDLRS
jgi:hypothetical protein